MVRELQLSPTLVGAVFACGGTGGVLGGLLAGRVLQRLGTGRSLVAGAALLGVMHLPAAIAGGPPLVAAAVLARSGIVAQLGFAVLQVSQTKLMQLQGEETIAPRTAGEQSTRYGLRPTAQWYDSAQSMLPASAARRT